MRGFVMKRVWTVLFVCGLATVALADQLTVEIHIPCPNTPTPPMPSSTLKDNNEWETLRVAIEQTGVGFWEEDVPEFQVDIGYTQVPVDVTGFDWTKPYDILVLSSTERMDDNLDRWWDVEATAYEQESAGTTDPVVDVYPGLEYIYGGNNYGPEIRKARKQAALMMARKVIWDAKQLIKRVSH